MIAVDSSALLAIALKEREREAFVSAIRANRCLIGATNVLESHMVLLERLGKAGVEFLDGTLARSQMEVVGFDEGLAAITRHAFDQYGKGRHPAALNFGDCMSYAVAKSRNVPLLFKGDDFRLTDILPALP